MADSFVLLNDGSSFVLLNDGSSKVILNDLVVVEQKKTGKLKKKILVWPEPESFLFTVPVYGALRSKLDIKLEVKGSIFKTITAKMNYKAIKMFEDKVKLSGKLLENVDFNIKVIGNYKIVITREFLVKGMRDYTKLREKLLSKLQRFLGDNNG